jgi:hypothetical protein
MAFRGKDPIRSKITLDNNPIIEQLSDFNYLGCDVTYKYDEDLNKKMNKCQSICGVISRTLKKSKKETNLKFYKVMAIPVLLYGCETWTLKKRDWNIIQGAEMKYLRTAKSCIKTDQLRNEEKGMSWVSPLYIKK